MTSFPKDVIYAKQNTQPLHLPFSKEPVPIHREEAGRD